MIRLGNILIFKYKKMKNLFLGSILLLALTSCGSNSGTKDNSMNSGTGGSAVTSSPERADTTHISNQSGATGNGGVGTGISNGAGEANSGTGAKAGSGTNGSGSSNRNAGN